MGKCLKFRHLIYIILWTQLYACGNPFPTKMNVKPLESLSTARNMVTCAASTGEEQQLIFNEFYHLDGQINQLVADYKRAYPSRILLLMPMDRASDLGPLHPLSLSLKNLTKNLNHIKSQFIEVLSTESYSQLLNLKKNKVLYHFTPSVNHKMIEQLILDVRKQASFAARFQNYQCKLNQLAMNADADVRTYLKLEKQLCGDFQTKDCLEQQLPSFKFLDVDKRKELHNDFIKICKVLDGRPSCEAYFAQFKRNKNLLALFKKYIESFKEKIFDPLFMTRKNPMKFSCRVENGVTIMSLPISFNQLDNTRFLGGIASATTFVETMWSNDSFKLEIKKQNHKLPHVFNVVFKAGVTSHADISDKKTITLNANLQKFALSKTFSHEIGHVIGFNDCYVEYFDHHSESIIYYELGRKEGNLMCSVEYGHKIPDSYFAQLKKNVCQF